MEIVYTIIVGVIVLGVLALALRSVIKNSKNGACSSCGGNCSCCNGCQDKKK